MTYTCKNMLPSDYGRRIWQVLERIQQHNTFDMLVDILYRTSTCLVFLFLSINFTSK